MELFLMGLCLSVLGVAAAAIAFAAATNGDGAARPAPVLKDLAALPPPRFFVRPMAIRAGEPPRVPVEALLLQVERHIRLEQAAAESFLDCPTAQSLHSPTASPLIH